MLLGMCCLQMQLTARNSPHWPPWNCAAKPSCSHLLNVRHVGPHTCAAAGLSLQRRAQGPMGSRKLLSAAGCSTSLNAHCSVAFYSSRPTKPACLLHAGNCSTGQGTRKPNPTHGPQAHLPKLQLACGGVFCVLLLLSPCCRCRCGACRALGACGRLPLVYHLDGCLHHIKAEGRGRVGAVLTD